MIEMFNFYLMQNATLGGFNINFKVMFGKLGADENTISRHENFQSEIRAGGVSLMYDFGNFIPDQFVADLLDFVI